MSVKPHTPAPRTVTAPKATGLAALVAVIGASAAAIVVPETKQWEGKSNKAYLDIAKVPTICFGDTSNVRMGQVASDAECDERLYRQLVAHAKPVMQCVPGLAAPNRVNQRAASVVFAYNIGTTAFCGSTAARRFNAGNWRGGCDAFLAWNKARINGVLTVSKGLTNRRNAERAICLKVLPA